ncbi:MAG: VOC family protein [Reichenbachiella sp.]|uniref:VOC family protein n=1 Tax=Reichenbachiella sp. TaxID=2184521 RepID=UPI003267D130
MKNAFMGLRTCIYRVGDLDEAMAWYAKIFSTEPYFKEAFYVGFDIGGYELGLIGEETGDQPKGGNVLTYWGVEDVQEAYDRLLSAGATEYEKPHNVGGEIVVGAVKDLWGNVVGVIYNPEFKIG